MGAKMKEREWLLTIAILVAIVADAVFDLGLDVKHIAGMIGAGGSFAVARGLAKQGAQRALPAAKKLAGDD